jgi:hypothetical protein
MTDDHAALIADPFLIEGWLRARSLARGLPAPTADSGGLRVETNSPDELRRYVFAALGDGLREVARAVVAPRVFLKVCAPATALAEVLPERWALQSRRYVMTRGGRMFDHPLAPPKGYVLELQTNGAVTKARIVSENGEPAAGGFAAEHGGVFIYDQIVTEAAHRRRGLGRILMGALESARRQGSAPQVLVATEDGRGLYTALGWRVHAPYSTATIPPARTDHFAAAVSAT